MYNNQIDAAVRRPCFI